MKLLEIMKNWGVNDTPNDIIHFEQEVAEHYQTEMKDALKLALVCLEQLRLHSVSNCIATEYAEFCVRCDREKLPLLCLEDYIKQYYR